MLTPDGLNKQKRGPLLIFSLRQRCASPSPWFIYQTPLGSGFTLPLFTAEGNSSIFVKAKILKPISTPWVIRLSTDMPPLPPYRALGHTLPICRISGERVSLVHPYCVTAWHQCDVWGNGYLPPLIFRSLLEALPEQYFCLIQLGPCFMLSQSCEILKILFCRECPWQDRNEKMFY